ncbi:helix-turn-helix domain-containing protein [Microtetraspora niveoalba]|uniref:helix-turn-helix domain-containing protein n=1 Tax=Microtetraspora niveoalba TaxID=46175 RepID=UPI000AD5765F|nr:helix-turn-helix domain-containing protein [Microtetraspora niveoalba]
MDETWTIGELAEQAAALLGAEPRRNGRVREVPNARLIRWYTTIGLLDPPLARRGRVALYSRRHLLQLVAIKRRQAEGLSIAAIQTELTGATDGMLERVAGLSGAPGTPPMSAPEAVPGIAAPVGTAGPPGRGNDPPDTLAAPPATSAGRAAQAGRAERFWTRRSSAPVPAGPAEPVDVSHAPPVSENAPPMSYDSVDRLSTPLHAADARWADGSPRAPVLADPRAGHTADPIQPRSVGPDLVYGLRLAPGVTVMLDGVTRPPTDRDLAALREAAAPLIADLVARGLAARPESSIEGS